MPGILCRIQPGAIRQFLHHARHVDTGQSARLDLPVAIDRAEQRPGCYGCVLDPTLNRADWARLRVRSVGYADLAARTLLVRLGPSQRHRQAILAEPAILNAQSDQFRTPECGSKSQ